MWNFPSTGAYFWFRLIAGDVPMVIVIISYYKIKKTLSLQGSIMSELMRHTIDQSTIVVKAGQEPKNNSNPISNYFSSRPQYHKMGNFIQFIYYYSMTHSITDCILFEKVTRQTRNVTIAFFMCWIPRQTLVLINVINPSMYQTYTTVMNLVTKMTVLIAFSNVAFVPLIYWYVNQMVSHG